MNKIEIRNPNTTWWRRVVLAALVLAAIPAAIAIVPRVAEAAWSETCESGKATFDIAPADRSVHATIAYEIVNLEPTTASRDMYYFRWGTTVPSEASNIKVFDQVRTMAVTLSVAQTYRSVRKVAQEDVNWWGNSQEVAGSSFDFACPHESIMPARDASSCAESF